MLYSEPAPTTTGRMRIRWFRIAGLLIAAVAIGALFGHEASSSSTAPAHRPIPRAEHRVAPGEPRRAPVLPRAGGSALGEADGAVPDGTTVFDSGVPGVARLRPALLGALRRAATDGAHEGVAFLVDSGWRSPAYQEQLFRQAVAKYGSAAEAARWVARPSRSAHVKGDAVDLGSGAAAWLGARGAAYGLCRVYANEPWHFELRPTATAHGCPALYADPTQDPRSRHE